MRYRRLQWMLLAALTAPAACTDAAPGDAGNTELNVIVPNGYDAGSSAPALIDIQDVEYTIDCAGNSDTFLDNDAFFADEVTLNGNLEVQDGRTNAAAIYGDPAFDGQAEIWQGFMDLPPGPCTIELRARDDDGEVICTAQEPFGIAVDSTSKVNIVLICDLSFQAPVGMLDVDGTFSFNVGNFCPDLFLLNCMDSAPQEQQVLPPPNPPLAGTGCQVRFRDGDSSCGAGCDPQTCVPNGLTGLTCTPGPDPGVSTTVTCANAWLDCEGDGTPDASCTFTGDTDGALGQQSPSFPGNPGDGGFFVTCIPPALGGTPGATATCTAVTTDGDVDCDKTKVVDVACFGEPPCFTFAQDQGFGFDGDAACQAAAGTACITSICDDTFAVAGSCAGGICCVDTPVADGTDCSAEIPPLAECQGGVCGGSCCISDSDCADGNPCTDPFPGQCDVVTCLCGVEPPSAPGSACDAGSGASSGACDGAGACQDICSFNPACPDDSNVCTVPACDPTDGTCSLVPGNEGVACDFSGPGSADGVCQTGSCIFAPGSCNLSQTGSDTTPQTAIVGVGCTNNVTTAQSPFPFTLSVDVPQPVIGGAPFVASFDGLGVFPGFFLDAAQAVVPGGVDVAELVDIVATVQVRSGATGPDVPLGADLGSLVPGPTQLCNFPPDQVCAADTECLGGVCNPAINLVALPTSTDCTPAGACALLGKDATQCAPNGFCITGDLIIEFAASGFTTYTADASGSVLFGWADQGVPGLTTCPAAAPACQDAWMPDGCYDLPAAVFANPTAPIGIRVNASGLFVPIQCAGGSPGGICASGEGCIVDADCATAPCTLTTDVICPTPDADLISCPIN